MLTCDLPFRLFIQAALEQRIGVLVRLGLPKIVNEAMSVVAADQFLPGHQRLFFSEFLKDTCSLNGANQIVASQKPRWQHAVLPLDQKHDGDDQGNVDVDKAMLVGNCTHPQAILHRLQPRAYFLQDLCKGPPLLSE